MCNEIFKLTRVMNLDVGIYLVDKVYTYIELST